MSWRAAGYPTPRRLSADSPVTRGTLAGRQALAALRHELLTPCPRLRAALGDNAKNICDLLIEQAVDSGHPMDWTLHMELASSAVPELDATASVALWREALLACGRRWIKWGQYTSPWLALVSCRAPATIVLAQRRASVFDEAALSVATLDDLAPEHELVCLVGSTATVVLNGPWQVLEPRMRT